MHPDEFNLILLQLSSGQGPSFSDLSSQYTNFSLFLPSFEGSEFSNKINGIQLKSFGSETNSNFKALSYIVFKHMFNDETTDQELLSVFFQDLIGDGEHLGKIQNYPYFEKIKKQHRKKLVGTMLIEIMKMVRQGKDISKQSSFNLILELFGICTRSLLKDINFLPNILDYKEKQPTNQVFNFILRMLDLPFIQKQKFYLFPQKSLFILSYDGKEFICGRYQIEKISSSIQEQKVNEVSKKQKINSLYSNFKLTFDDNLGQSSPGDTPHFDDDLPTPKFNRKVSQRMVQSIQINISPILEVENEDTYLQPNTPNTIAAMLNSSISHNRTISDFNPHECLSDEEETENETNKKKESIVLMRESNFRFDTPLSTLFQSQDAFQTDLLKTKSQMIKIQEKMKKIRKKSFSDNLKDQNNLPNKSELKNLGAKTERKKIKDKIKTILQKEQQKIENKAGEKKKIKIDSNLYQVVLNPQKKRESFSKRIEKRECKNELLKKVKSIEIFRNKNLVNEKRPKIPSIPKFLLKSKEKERSKEKFFKKRSKKHHHKKEEENFKEFSSQKLLKPKIFFNYESPPKKPESPVKKFSPASRLRGSLKSPTSYRQLYLFSS